MRLVLGGAGLLVALVAAAFLVAGTGDTVSAKEGDTATVTMGPGRDASQTGTATLTDMGSQTQVVLNIQPGPTGIEQPVHIHAGSCPCVGVLVFLAPPPARPTAPPPGSGRAAPAAPGPHPGGRARCGRAARVRR